ncbi:MAG: restriction endonuclease subunit S [Muribaculaceae bacterium]|nr:restriction endonuclease subunit S [Muribaculaceae bacterium]
MKQGWEIKKLGECFEYIKNGANIKQERGAGGIPITRIETLSGGVFNRDRLGYADIETIDNYQSYVMESGDLLLSHINSKAYIGRVVVYEKDGDETIIHGMNLLRLKVTSEIISPFYFYHYSQTHKFKSQIANRRKDAVNQSSISVTDLKTIDVPIPPLAEQEKIVAELDCLSGVIEKKKQQLKELDALAESIFYTMFGDPITNEKGWEEVLLKNAAVLKAGKSIKANELSGIPNEGLFPCYGGNGIRGYINKKSHNGSFPIIGRQGALCGNVVFAQGEFYATEHAVVCNNIIDDINPMWMYYTLRFNNLNRFAQGVAQPGISVNIINEMSLIFPPLALQQEFADKIEAIEKQKELIKQSIKEIEELFNSRMDYYFN